MIPLGESFVDAAGAAPPRPRARAWLVLAGLVLLVHALALIGPLVFDDEHAVRDNTAIQELANVPAFFVDPDLFSATQGRMYRPLVLTSLALDHAVGDGDAWAFKLGNLVQHLLLALLLFGLLPELFLRAGLCRTLVPRATWITTLLFALHPLHVESLCLVSSRSEILMAIGLVLALGAALHFGGTAGRPARPVRQALGVAFGTAWACLSKETGVLVPAYVGLVLFVLAPAGRGLLGRAGLALRGAAAGVPVALVYLVLRKLLFGVATTGLRAFQTGGDPYAGGARDFETQLLSMTQFLPKAIGLWLFPSGLNLDHTRFDPLAFGDARVLLGLACVAVPLLLALFFWRRRPLYALGVLGAFGFALPWIVVPLNVPLAEHRLYTPVLLLSLPAGVALARLGAAELRIPERWRPLLASVPFVLLVLLAARSVRRQFDWHEPQRLWSSALAHNELSFRALCGLADLAWEAGDLRGALRELERAMAIYDRYLPAKRNLCEVRLRLAERGDDPQSVRETVRLVESFAEERWKDPFVRLQAARARIALHAHGGAAADLRIARAWALSCLAMVERKMLVYLQASEAEKRAGDWTRALALFDDCREHGLENEAFLAAMGDCLVAAGAHDEARRLLVELTGEPITAPVVLGFAQRLAEATGDRRLHAWAKGGLLQLSFGLPVAPPR